jgi:hypothetical protein
MANRNSGHRPGGGIASRVNTQPSVRTGSGSKSTRPAGTAQIGTAVGDHITREGSTGYRGEKLHNPSKDFQPVPFGNQVALNVKGGGPGVGRTVYGQSGNQGTHGSTNPGAPGLPSTRGQWPDK